MKINIQPFGDQALLVQWEQMIDPEINNEVIRLDNKIQRSKIQGVTFSIPAYCSLTVGFQPDLISYQQLGNQIRELHQQSDNTSSSAIAPRKITIPVCYEGAYAPDLDWLSQHFGLEPEQIIHLHTHAPFRVYMLGFMPGFPYMGKLPQALETPRKTSPRLRVPAGAVGLAGLQTGIYPIESPGGWQIIGRTPLKIFDPEREQPFLLAPGDEVHFEAISEADFQNLKN